MTWINFLHFYQPANLEDWKILEAYEKSYRRLVKAWRENPNSQMTVNFSACLLERLDILGKKSFLNDFQKLISREQIEVVGSVAYHPLLPLIPEEEIIRQIIEQEDILEEKLGITEKPAGFFIPEMAVSKKVLKVIKKAGYLYVILDPVCSLEEVDIEKIYKDKDSGLLVVFRDRQASRAYAPDYILEDRFQGENLITATDAELYGLRHEDPSGELEKVLASEIETKTISEFISSFSGEINKISLRPASWETEIEDLEAGQPFAMWFHKKNKIHKNLWRLANLSLKLSEKKDVQELPYIRWHLVRGLASCTFWWASGRDFSKQFGPVAWSPDEVERGLNDLIRSIRSLPEKYNKYKIKAEKWRLKISQELWWRHWHSRQ